MDSYFLFFHSLIPQISVMQALHSVGSRVPRILALWGSLFNDAVPRILALWGSLFNDAVSTNDVSDYILITNFIHWLLFIHKILFSSTCFEPQVLILRRIQLYTCSIWYCHSLWEFVVACRYIAWVRTDWRGKVVSGRLKRVCNLWHTFTS